MFSHPSFCIQNIGSSSLVQSVLRCFALPGKDLQSLKLQRGTAESELLGQPAFSSSITCSDKAFRVPARRALVSRSFICRIVVPWGCCSVVLLSLLMSACQGLGGGSSATPTPTPAPAGSLNSLNHLILFMQENRSFDTYFGQLNAYRAKQTPPLPQDVDTWTSGADKTPTNVSTPGL